MIHFRQGDFKTANQMFQKGVRDCPFFVSVPYFRTALAVAKLRQRKYADAVDILANQKGEVADVLRLHAEGEQGHSDKAHLAKERLNSSQRSRIIRLRDELAGGYLVGQSMPAIRTVDWCEGIYEQEYELVAFRIAA